MLVKTQVYFLNTLYTLTFLYPIHRNEHYIKITNIKKICYLTAISLRTEQYHHILFNKNYSFNKRCLQIVREIFCNILSFNEATSKHWRTRRAEPEAGGSLVWDAVFHLPISIGAVKQSQVGVQRFVNVNKIRCQLWGGTLAPYGHCVRAVEIFLGRPTCLSGHSCISQLQLSPSSDKPNKHKWRSSSFTPGGPGYLPLAPDYPTPMFQILWCFDA